MPSATSLRSEVARTIASNILLLGLVLLVALSLTGCVVVTAPTPVTLPSNVRSAVHLGLFPTLNADVNTRLARSTAAVDRDGTSRVITETRAPSGRGMNCTLTSITTTPPRASRRPPSTESWMYCDGGRVPLPSR